MARMPVAFDDMTDFVVQAVRVKIPQDLDNANAIGTAGHPIRFGAWLIVDLVDEFYMNQHLLVGYRQRRGFAGATCQQ